MTLLFLLLTSLNDSLTLYPEWFFKTPNNMIVVVVGDNYTRLGRARALYQEANKLLAYKNSGIKVSGDDASMRDNQTEQKDKYRITITLIENEYVNFLEQMNYEILDYERYDGKLLLALFGKKGSSFASKRVLMKKKPQWVNEPETVKNEAIGFSVKNVYRSSDWISAFNHAVYNLAKNQSTQIVNQTETQKNQSSLFNSSSYFNVNIAMVDATIHQFEILERWIDPEDGAFFVRVKSK